MHILGCTIICFVSVKFISIYYIFSYINVIIYNQQKFYTKIFIPVRNDQVYLTLELLYALNYFMDLCILLTGIKLTVKLVFNILRCQIVWVFVAFRMFVRITTVCFIISYYLRLNLDKEFDKTNSNYNKDIMLSVIILINNLCIHVTHASSQLKFHPRIVVISYFCLNY